MTATNEVTAIIVTFNSAHCAEALAGGLRGLRHVLIIDNASDDGSAEVFQRVLPQAKVIRNSKNLGFGAANNIGIAATTTPYVLLVNPDVIFSPEQLSLLLEVAQQHPEAAIVAPQLDRSPALGDDGMRCVDFVCGAFLLARSADLKIIGGFDEQFFLYYEDDDLCRRLRQRGRAILFVPQVRRLNELSFV